MIFDIDFGPAERVRFRRIESLGPRRTLPVLRDVPRPAARSVGGRDDLRSSSHALAAPGGRPRAVGDGPTLDDLVVGAWEGLSAHRTSACPVCPGTLRAARPSSGEGLLGRCDRCGSELR